MRLTLPDEAARRARSRPILVFLVAVPTGGPSSGSSFYLLFALQLLTVLAEVWHGCRCHRSANGDLASRRSGDTQRPPAA
ncbi:MULTISPECIES: hypothetical protein [Frankia]|uniref:hypothetical protein n=1 Tax=Frankia TaxID=1854 RepID=UPI0012FF6C80|nr:MULTISPECIES: hypothetical protein [Frankia]